jgi:hypothetical protein
LKGALGDRDELPEQRDDLLASKEVSGVVLLAGFVPADLVGEQRTDCDPTCDRRLPRSSATGG